MGEGEMEAPGDAAARTSAPAETAGATASQVVLEDGGAVIGRARVTAPSSDDERAVVGLEPDPTRASPQQRADLVDAALDHDAVGRRVHVVAPLGDAHTIGRLQERTEEFSAHPAGASSVIDAQVVAAEANRPATQDGSGPR